MKRITESFDKNLESFEDLNSVQHPATCAELHGVISPIRKTNEATENIIMAQLVTRRLN